MFVKRKERKRNKALVMDYWKKKFVHEKNMGRERASTSTSVKQEQGFMATSQFSLSKSSPLMQQKGSKKKRVMKKPLSPKSKGKQIVSSKPKKSESSKGKRTQINELYECIEDYYSVKEQAGKLLLSLEADLADLPGFGKRMLPSNVTFSFWMILPLEFCKSHLPNHDTIITLVDESGEEFKTNFLSVRHGLSAGWRGFSIGHRLIKGDILLFHLVEPCKFKVHIARVHSLDMIEAALCLMKIDAKEKAAASAKGKKHKKVKKDSKANNKRIKLLEAQSMDKACSSHAEFEFDSKGALNVDLCHATELSGSSSDSLSSKVFEGSKIDTDDLRSNELNGSGSLCYRGVHLQEGISCRSAVQRYDSSSTVAT